MTAAQIISNLLTLNLFQGSEKKKMNLGLSVCIDKRFHFQITKNPTQTLATTEGWLEECLQIAGVG